MLRRDIDRVEFWADAVDGLAQPIPEYPLSNQLSRHLLPPDAVAAEHPAAHVPQHVPPRTERDKLS